MTTILGQPLIVYLLISGIRVVDVRYFVDFDVVQISDFLHRIPVVVVGRRLSYALLLCRFAFRSIGSRSDTSLLRYLTIAAFLTHYSFPQRHSWRTRRCLFLIPMSLSLGVLMSLYDVSVIADDIHVSLIFPPDTETLGLEHENKLHPELTKIIAGSSGKAEDVAKKAIDGIKSARFIIPCNFEGFLLSIATAGLSPQTSYLMAFAEVIFAGILRIAGLFFQWDWYRNIEKWHSKKK